MKGSVGWAALAMSMLGHTLAARGDRRGWVVRLAAGAVWMVFAVLNHSAVYIATSALYMAIDGYGAVRRYREKPSPFYGIDKQVDAKRMDMTTRPLTRESLEKGLLQSRDRRR